MARGLKIAKNDTTGGTQTSGSIQKDQAIGPQQYTVATSTNTNATVYIGGTGGVTAGTTSLVVLINYKDASGNLYTDGQIIKQKGSRTFLAQSQSGGASTLSRVVLTPVAPGSLTASQGSIKGVDNLGNLFYASRITDKFVWNGTYENASSQRFPYVLATTPAITYIDTTSGPVVTNAGGYTYSKYAVVEGF